MKVYFPSGAFDTLVFSDLHLHDRKELSKINPNTGLSTRLEEGLSILDQIIDILTGNPEITTLLFLGDLFELKDRVPNHILIECKKRFEKPAKRKIIFKALKGNHDFNLTNYPIIQMFDSFMEVITEPVLMSTFEMAFIPYQKEMKDFYDALAKLNKLEPRFVFFHQELPGGEYESGKRVPGSIRLITKSLMNPNTTYISGHLHKPQTVGEIIFVGAPYHTKHGVEGDRYILLLHSQTKEMKRIKLEYPEFITISFEDMKDKDYLKSSINNNHIRFMDTIEKPEDWASSKKIIREKLESLEARSVTFKVAFKRPTLVKLPSNKLYDDREVIKTYLGKEYGNDPQKERLIQCGLEIFDKS